MRAVDESVYDSSPCDPTDGARRAETMRLRTLGDGFLFGT